MADKSIKQPSAQQPKWQRARIVDIGNPADEKEAVGLLIWVTGEKWKCPGCEGPSCDGFLIETNWRGAWPSQKYVHLRKIELLAEFADEVPIVRYDDLVAEAREAKERHA